MNKRTAILLVTKIVLVTALCLVLSGCQFFCTLGALLTLATKNTFTGNAWFGYFTDCADADENDICPAGGWFYGDPTGPVSCEPGTILPSHDSLVVSLPEAAPTDLPQSPPARRARRVAPPPPAAPVDCSDSANAATAACANSNRQNKPRPSPPGQ